MYPRNAASPNQIAIGPVVQISDGAVQTSGCTVRIIPIGVAEGDGAGTTAYSTDGVVLYTPTQAETNYTSFVLIAKKTGCIPSSVTVVTTGSATAGTVAVKSIGGTDQSTGDLAKLIAAVNTAVVAGVASVLQASTQEYITDASANRAGTYAATYLSNGVYWTTAPTTAVGGFGLNVNLFYTAAAAQVISSVTIRGFFNAGTGRNCNVYAYNYATAAWDQLSDSVSRMNNATTNQAYTYTLLSSHQKQTDPGGSGYELDANGAIRIGFKSASATTTDRLNIDQCIVNVATAGASAADIADAVYTKLLPTVYSGGITIDTVAGTAGTTLGVNGTPTNPSLTYADAIALADNLGVKRFYLRPGSSITLTQSHANWRFIGDGTIALGGQAIDKAVFEDIYSITGTSTGEDMVFDNCGIGTATLDHSYFSHCKFKGTLTLVTNKEYFVIDCSDASPSAGSSCVFVFTTGTIADFRKWSGGIQLNGMVTGTYAYIDGAGRVVIDASSTGGSITIRGNFAAATGASTFTTAGGTITQTARFATDQVMADTAGTTTLLARVGAFTGSGINTVLGFFKALLSKAASAPSDVGGTFDPATDSTEGIKDYLPANWNWSTFATGGSVVVSGWSATTVDFSATMKTSITTAATAATPTASVDSAAIFADPAHTNLVATANAIKAISDKQNTLLEVVP